MLGEHLPLALTMSAFYLAFTCILGVSLDHNNHEQSSESENAAIPREVHTAVVITESA
jgi:hypothetical protein